MHDQKKISEFKKLTGMTPDEFKEMFERVKTMNEKENRFSVGNGSIACMCFCNFCFSR